MKALSIANTKVLYGLCKKLSIFLEELLVVFRIVLHTLELEEYYSFHYSSPIEEISSSSLPYKNSGLRNQAKNYLLREYNQL